MAVFHGTKHDDNLTGTTGDDTFDLQKGGEDTASGGDGNDIFNMGASFDAGDRIDGGTGRDVVFLHGDYSAGLVFEDLTIQNVEVLRLGAGFNYNLTTADGNVAAGQALTIDAGPLGAGNHLTFDGSAELDGRFVLYASAGDDVLTGGAKADKFQLDAGGNDTVHGGGGNDVFLMGGAFTSADVIDGGTGNDTLSLDGDYSGADLTISDAQITNVETVDFLAKITGNKTTFITGDIAGGHTLDIDVALTTTRFSLDLSGATSAAYDITTNAVLSTVAFGGNFSSTDKYHNAGDRGVLRLNGDYSGGLTLSGANIGGLQELDFNGDFSYSASVVGKIGQTGANGFISLKSNVSAGHSVFLDLTQSTAGNLDVNHIGAGDLTVKFAGNFSSNDQIDAAAGATTVELDGDYSAGLSFVNLIGPTRTLNSVTTLKLDDGFSYKLTMNEANGGTALTVDATALTAGHTLIFDGTNDPSGLTFDFGAGFSVSDSITGGAGNDTVHLNSNGNFTFTATTLTNVEDLIVNSSGIAITTNDATVASGATLTVDFSPTNDIGGDSVTFDGSTETDGHFNFIAPAEMGGGFLIVTGGALSDTFTLGNDDTPDNTINGGGGDDTLTLTTTSVGVQFNGGAGNDTLALTGGGTIIGDVVSLTSVETLAFDDHNWNVTSRDTMVDSGATLTVDASALTSTHSLDFNGSGETDGAFAITGGAGHDTITGGANADTIAGGLGADTLTGGGGADTFSFAALSESNTVDGYDTITDLGATDSIHIAGGVPTFFVAGNEDTYQGSLDNDLIDFFSHLGAGQYGVVTLTGDTDPLKGHVFLVIDGDGQTGYTAGADYVIDITGYGGDPSQIHFT